MQPSEKYRHFVDAEGEPLNRLLSAVERVVLHRFRGALRDRGHRVIAAAQMQALQQLSQGGLRISTLAGRLHLSKQAVGQLVRGLEGEGLVRSTVDPTDGRARLVSPTAAGLELVSGAVDAIRGIEADLGRDIGHAALRELKRSLGRILERAGRGE